FFAVLTSSFRWGFTEGMRITAASAGIFLVHELMLATSADLPRIALRSAFLLTLGYMSAQWGELKVISKLRLALLHDVTRLSNPRFGVDQTLAMVLGRIQGYFGPGECILITQEGDSTDYSLRSVRAGGPKAVITRENIAGDAARPLMIFEGSDMVVYSRPSWSAATLPARCHVYRSRTNRWERCETTSSNRLAELLDATTFIAVPVSMKKGGGRLYLFSRERTFGKGDVLFLAQVAAQVFPTIENIEVLDRMASDAALRERHRIAWDLHDTAIQPYIGLKLALSALCNKAAPDNPLRMDLNRLAAMATQVIDDLRHYARTFRAALPSSDGGYLPALQRHIERIRDFYGIDITLRTDASLGISDRLGVEVLQIVREGLSNICKHTNARRGAVDIRAADGLLAVHIENECTGAQPADFIPHSILERARALGGNASIRYQPGSATIVQVAIPI
ncbi:MAG: two-component system sensor kinase, partial [Paucimonas sp.]|nr:two-component system sensor kinase [Paucimonas sp.]